MQLTICTTCADRGVQLLSQRVCYKKEVSFRPAFKLYYIYLPCIFLIKILSMYKGCTVTSVWTVLMEMSEAVGTAWLLTMYNSDTPFGRIKSKNECYKIFQFNSQWHYYCSGFKRNWEAGHVSLVSRQVSNDLLPHENCKPMMQAFATFWQMSP